MKNGKIVIVVKNARYLQPYHARMKRLAEQRLRAVKAGQDEKQRQTQMRIICAAYTYGLSRGASTTFVGVNFGSSVLPAANDN